MGTNFYLFTKAKRRAELCNYALTDTPDFGYMIHIAKTSCGWLPLFETHKDIVRSVKDIKALYDSGDFTIYDEYDTEYTWNEFDERVLQFNGGVEGKITPKMEVDDDGTTISIPISHMKYKNGQYAYMYFKDNEGYEFAYGEFS